MQGGALATEIGQSVGGNKDTSAGQIAGSALASLFGAKVMPLGEEMHREDTNQYYDMIKGLGKDDSTYKKFWDVNPDYNVYNYRNIDDPEELYHKVLIDNLWNAYNALPSTQKTEVSRALPERFDKLFLSSDTRSYDALENDEIVEWTRAMHGNIPEFSDQDIVKPMQDAQELNWYADSIQADWDRYQRDVDRLFPGIKEIQNGYFDTPEELQPQYLIDHPMLKEYWDYNDGVKEANPRLAVYINDRSLNYKVSDGQYADLTSAVMGSINDWTKGKLRNYIDKGWKLPEDAERSLRIAYNSLQSPVPFEEWIRTIPLEKK